MKTHPRLNRILSALALLGWSGALLYFYASGRITKYLAPDFRPYVLFGGLGLAIVGLFVLLTVEQGGGCGHDHGPDEDHHEHDHEGPDIHPVLSLLILLVPVALCVSWTRDGFFSATSLARKGAYSNPAQSGLSFLSADLPPLTREMIERQHPENAQGFREFSLTDLFFSSGDPEVRGLIEGMPVVTEGRMVADRDGPPNQKRLYRLYITCCAADSQAIPVVLRFSGPLPEAPENSWMKVSGTLRFPDEGAGPIPVVEVAAAVPGDAPSEESFMRGAGKF